MNITALKQVFILSGVILFSSLNVTAQRTNFSGVWGIDISKSDFGNVPSYAVVKQFDINQNNDTVFIKRVAVNPDGVQRISMEEISLDGKLCATVLPKGKITSAITWSSNNQTMTINSSYRDSENPEIAYKISQAWSLSTNKNELTVSMVTPGYSIRTVYIKTKKEDFGVKEKGALDKEPLFDPKVITAPKIIFFSVIPSILIMYGSFLFFTRRRK
jgi:hypothetical protein